MKLGESLDAEKITYNIFNGVLKLFIQSTHIKLREIVIKQKRNSLWGTLSPSIGRNATRGIVALSKGRGNIRNRYEIR
jgi:hypothetical protein